MPGYILMVVLLLLVRFDWPGLMAMATTGIISGVAAEIIMIRSKTDILIYMKKLIISVLISAGSWSVSSEILKVVAQKLWGWGWWLTSYGMALKNMILFAPGVMTAVIWTIIAEKKCDKAILVLTCPAIHFAVWWYIINTLLSCLPT